MASDTNPTVRGPALPAGDGRPDYLCERCWDLFDDARPYCLTPGCGQEMPRGGWAFLPYRFKNRFVFQKLLGRGGMGAVFLAFDEQAARDDQYKGLRAIKVVQRRGGPDQVSKAIALFDNEARAAGFLAQSKKFVDVEMFDRTEPPCLVMTYIDIPTLTAKLEESGGCLPPMDGARLGVAVLTALSKMHGLHWVHRDLKPDNIFVHREKGRHDWQVKIADLGLWAVSADVPKDGSGFGTGSMLEWGGTIDFMSPEQAEGKALTCASDVHAVGTILWQAVAGAPPWKPTTGNAIAAAGQRFLATETVPPRPARIPAALHAVFARALAPRPGDRYANAVEMLAALDDYVSRTIAERGAALEHVKREMGDAEQQLAGLRARLDQLRPLDDEARRIDSEIAALRESREAWEPEDLGTAVFGMKRRVDSLARGYRDAVGGAAPTPPPPPPVQVTLPDALGPPQAAGPRRIALFAGAGGAALLSLAVTLLAAKTCGTPPNPVHHDGGTTAPIAAYPPDLATGVTVVPLPGGRDSIDVKSSQYAFELVTLDGKPACRSASGCSVSPPDDKPFTVVITGKAIRRWSKTFSDLADARAVLPDVPLELDL